MYQKQSLPAQRSAAFCPFKAICAVSEEDADTARARGPVQDPFHPASPGNHAGKALVTASQKINAAILHGDFLIPEYKLVS